MLRSAWHCTKELLHAQACITEQTQELESRGKQQASTCLASSVEMYFTPCLSRLSDVTVKKLQRPSFS